MKARYVIRKDSGDRYYPWALRDRHCANGMTHDFKDQSFGSACWGECDAYVRWSSAMNVIDRKNR